MSTKSSRSLLAAEEVRKQCLGLKLQVCLVSDSGSRFTARVAGRVKTGNP